VTAELQQGFRIVREHTTTPLELGEIFNTVWQAKLVITEQLIDYLRMTVLHGGGITNLKKVAAFADMHHVQMGCHGATDLSPVTMAAALHFDISISNFGIQEYMRHTKETDEVFPHGYYFRDGYLHPGEQPGLGVDYDEKLAAKFPYERAYLPLNRKLDGTMWNW
jgi:mannonate dehydratase